MYGILTFHHEGVEVKKQYMIVKRYLDYKTILREKSFGDKVEIIRSGLNLVASMLNRRNPIYYRDVKPANMGCDEQLNYIVLDYDEKTLFSIAGIPPERLKAMAKSNIGSTYLPYYYLYQATLPDGSINFDNIYMLGFVFVIIEFLYGSPKKSSSIHKNIFHPFGLNHQTQAEIVKRFNDTYINVLQILEQISTENRFSDILQRLNPLVISMLGIEIKEGIPSLIENSSGLPKITDIIIDFDRIFPLPVGKNKYYTMKMKYINLKKLITL